MNQAETSRQAIPALWIIVAVPLATIVASAVTVWLAVSGAEPELPAYYHTEGLGLEADLLRSRRAAELGVRAELAVAADGNAIVALTMDSPRARLPDALELRLTHATLAAHDRSWTLVRGRDGIYRGRTSAPGAGPWLVQLDAGEDWRLRGRLTDIGSRLHLGHDAP